MTAYADAVRRGSAAAARLHNDLETEKLLVPGEEYVDVFKSAAKRGVAVMFQPLVGVLGAYLRDPSPGILVSTNRPLAVQRLTVAHEIGHHELKHVISLDSESNILRRAPASNFDPQEVEAESFASSFLMPRWLIPIHCQRQQWRSVDFNPEIIYQLSLRLGSSYQATCWTLARYRYLSEEKAAALADVKPRTIKKTLLEGYAPKTYKGDVWLLTERDAGFRIVGSRGDLFVVKLGEHSGGGYLWDFDELARSELAIVRDSRRAADGVGSNSVRIITAFAEHPQNGELRLTERRPWKKDSALNKFSIAYSMLNPEQAGLSREERHLILGDAA